MRIMTKKICFFAWFCSICAISFLFPEEMEKPAPVFHPHAIFIASYQGDEKMVREILAADPDKDARDALGATALHGAMFQQNAEVVKLLLAHGFDPDAVNNRGFTPLHNAVTANNLEAAKLLLAYGANKRIKCHEGHTPLDKARQGEKGAMINLLR